MTTSSWTRERLPLRRVVDRVGEPLLVPVELPGRVVHAAVWLAQVGRVPLLLLDTDIPENDEADRPITHILYVRGREMRLHQELVLGVGGVRALRALGIAPSAWHLNEGHSAFMLVEQARELMAEGTSQSDAFERVRRSAVFTIHTPVPAGNERFSADLVRRLAAPSLAGAGMDLEGVLETGRPVDGDSSQFDMTAFSLRNTCCSNGVSQLHAHTANETWSAIISKPILAITNGIHPPTWVGEPMRQVFRELGGDLDHLEDEYEVDRFWERLDQVPDRRLWESHLEQKQRLQEFARLRLRRQLARHGEAPSVLGEVGSILDPDVLTIGFARRMATYKRAALLFSDMDRLTRLLGHPERPVQIVFAGKAHPADRPGQGVIQTIFERSRSEAFRGRIFILEDYDMRVGRYLVQGTDVWLNNPRRPLEASGTSGMKAAMNGVINLSILDGWWDEGYLEDNGWAIGSRDRNPDDGAQDWADAQSLYRLLEDEVVPLWYDRDEHGPARGLAGTHAARHRHRPVAVLDLAHAGRVRGADVPAGRRLRDGGSAAGCRGAQASAAWAWILGDQVARPGERAHEAEARVDADCRLVVFAYGEPHDAVTERQAGPRRDRRDERAEALATPARHHADALDGSHAVALREARHGHRLVCQPDDPGAQPASLQRRRRLSRRRSA